MWETAGACTEIQQMLCTMANLCPVSAKKTVFARSKQCDLHIELVQDAKSGHHPLDPRFNVGAHVHHTRENKKLCFFRRAKTLK